MSVVAGIDSSTQSVKVVVCDSGSGRVLRTARAALPNGTEVAADAWWRAYGEATADPDLMRDVEALAVGATRRPEPDQHDPANLARSAIEGVLWSLAYGLAVMQEQTGAVQRVILTGGASRSPAVRQIALSVFGLPIAATEEFESVAVGAARQAAWALSGRLPEWPVPVAQELEPADTDRRAARDIGERYRSVLANFGG